MAVWLLALGESVRESNRSRLPRRLVYVVNRRTIVDQATAEAQRLGDALLRLPALAHALNAMGAQSHPHPLAISTLRGEFADNAEWRVDPARPAIIVGTVDMVGSRLLFHAYGRGFKSRPLHAGFLAQDTILVHDEAHLEPAFQALIEAMQLEQARSRDIRPMRVMALTATMRCAGTDDSLFDWSAHLLNQSASGRLNARKRLHFHPVPDAVAIVPSVLDCALRHRDSGQAVLVYLRLIDDVQSVARSLAEAGLPCQTLTGTLRGWERDALAREDPVFARFLPNASAGSTVYLVATSAGEVGVNISADHLVCDLTPFESMAQRFGRVNRFGTGDARIDIVHEGVPSADADGTPYAHARGRTLALLAALPEREDGSRDASPAALAGLPDGERQAAFSPPPAIPHVSDILFDAWALTSVRDPLPGCPPVTDWLHGLTPRDPPGTYVAWRDEVALLAKDPAGDRAPADLLDDYPLKPHELLRDRADRVFHHIEAAARRCPHLFAWLARPNGGVDAMSLDQLTERFRKRKIVGDMADCIVILPPEAGGLGFERNGRCTGLLDGRAPFAEDRRAHYDIADRLLDAAGRPQRCRVWDDAAAPAGMRLVRTLEVAPVAPEGGDSGDDDIPRLWRWFVRPADAEDDGSQSALFEMELPTHLAAVESVADALVRKLGLPETEAVAIRCAARWHDEGKRRAAWQRALGNRSYPGRVLAKSATPAGHLDADGYRHEFGSALDMIADPVFMGLPADIRDLALHLVAAHHGRARPHFSRSEAFDPEGDEAGAAELARETPRRFARLQRKYGRWGLAYLESLVRAADALGSRMPAPSPSGTSRAAACPSPEISA